MYFCPLFDELDITTFMTVKIDLLQARPLICDSKHNYINSFIDRHWTLNTFLLG